MSGSMLKNGAMAMLLIVGFAGCTKAAKPPEEPKPAYGPVVVDVENHNWNTVVIYAWSHGQLQRLGEVSTGAAAELDTPVGTDPTATDFQLIVDPIGSRQTFRTGRILVSPGDRVRLQVENDLSLSTFTTRSAGE